jgi:hypothetical protein
MSSSYFLFIRRSCNINICRFTLIFSWNSNLEYSTTVCLSHAFDQDVEQLLFGSHLVNEKRVEDIRVELDQRNNVGLFVCVVYKFNKKGLPELGQIYLLEFE